MSSNGGASDHTGEIGFWSLAQKRLAIHHVVDDFGNIRCMIADAFKILYTKYQVSFAQPEMLVLYVSQPRYRAVAHAIRSADISKALTINLPG